jgi:hypothetical protein
MGQHEMLYVDENSKHNAETHDDLPVIDDAANEESEDEGREDAAGAG